MKLCKNCLIDIKKIQKIKFKEEYEKNENRRRKKFLKNLQKIERERLNKIN
jgi:hypothetical protein